MQGLASRGGRTTESRGSGGGTKQVQEAQSDGGSGGLAPPPLSKETEDTEEGGRAERTPVRGSPVAPHGVDLETPGVVRGQKEMSDVTRFWPSWTGYRGEPGRSPGGG